MREHVEIKARKLTKKRRVEVRSLARIIIETPPRRKGLFRIS
jgi:hypothetical protein